MTAEAERILKAVYAAYDKNENYTISTPPSGKIHAYNMALREIAPYIEFTRSDMSKISMTLTEQGLEYCMENY